MKKVEFTKPFANKKKGDTIELDGLLASNLVHTHKVAKYFVEGKKSKK